ncbi:hypothetical protein V1478_003255 [Vespula squamosa]|uniref:Uncharacterized protein n=1 Tax=Vespula squamosa TaxID=30214 RepID=A0ABD2BSG3_VESSQ
MESSYKSSIWRNFQGKSMRRAGNSVTQRYSNVGVAEKKNILATKIHDTKKEKKLFEAEKRRRDVKLMGRKEKIHIIGKSIIRSKKENLEKGKVTRPFVKREVPYHLKGLFQRNVKEIPEEETKQIVRLLKKDHQDVFIKSSFDIGRRNLR